MALSLPEGFKIDVHTHPVPDFYRQALIDAGHTTRGDELIMDGFVTPRFEIRSYMESRARFGIGYSILSITAPGTTFLKGNARAASLARQLNDEMQSYINHFPKQLGAFCCLPLPNIEASLAEIKYCMDELHFDGVGLYTNYNGRYLGDTFLDPIFEELDRRRATVLVHPTAPALEVKLPSVGTPAVEYMFDTTRAITNLLFTGTRKRFPNINIIFLHGGGTVPYLAYRIASQSTIPWQGGHNASESMKELQGYYYDTAVASSPIQLAALKSFVGADSLLFGSDYPYFPESMLPPAVTSLNDFDGFSKEELSQVLHGNALKLFPRIWEKLFSGKA